MANEQEPNQKKYSHQNMKGQEIEGRTIHFFFFLMKVEKSFTRSRVKIKEEIEKKSRNGKEKEMKGNRLEIR